MPLCSSHLSHPDVLHLFDVAILYVTDLRTYSPTDFGRSRSSSPPKLCNDDVQTAARADPSYEMTPCYNPQAWLTVEFWKICQVSLPYYFYMKRSRKPFKRRPRPTHSHISIAWDQMRQPNHCLNSTNEYCTVSQTTG